MKAKEFDKKFDLGKDVIHALDLENSKRLNQESKNVELTIPTWLLELLDKEAEQAGMDRQSIIKLWLAERIVKESV